MNLSKITFGPGAMRRLFNLWPVFRGAGIRVREIGPDFRSVTVELRAKLLNRNYVGTHFGGSLFAMTDPFFMIMLLRNLGSEYLVWDKSGSIEYVAPGRGIVSAHFRLTQERIDEIKVLAAPGEKIFPQFAVDVLDAGGEVVAKVQKTLYVRLKPRSRPTGGTA